MKTIKLSSVIIAMMFIAGVSQLNAQVVREIVDQDLSQFVDCLNDGMGEYVEGVVQVNVVTHPDGSFTATPMGGYVIGSETGITYQAVGVTSEMINVNNQTVTYTFINRYHFVGKGDIFYWDVTQHGVLLPDGTVKYTIIASDIGCK
jgi:hypothetical protein